MRSPTPPSAPSLLRGLDIIPVLEAASGENCDKSVIITCYSMADADGTEPNPRIELVMRKVPILTDRSDRCNLVEAVNIFCFQVNTLHQIYLLCDRYAKGNQPPSGVDWDEGDRTACTKASLMGCLVMLFRSKEI